MIFLSGRMQEEFSEEGGGGGAMSLAPRLYKAKLEDAITAKQEFEARVETMETKLKQQETEISNLRLRVISFVFFYNLQINSSVFAAWLLLMGVWNETHLFPF